MQIILLEKVVNLGNLGDIVKVKDGYARNFLIPSGRARRATEANKAEFEARRAELEKAAAANMAGGQHRMARHRIIAIILVPWSDTFDIADQHRRKAPDGKAPWSAAFAEEIPIALFVAK